MKQFVAKASTALSWLIMAMSIMAGSARAEVFAIKGCFGDTGFDFGITIGVMIEKLPDNAETWSCFDEECRARRDIACAVNALSHRLRPNKMGYDSYAEADRYWNGYGRVLLAFGRSHPRRNPLYCSLLAQVARRITGHEERYDRTARNVVELALMANEPDNRCIRTVLAALPDVRSVREDRRNWNIACFPDFRKCRRILREVYSAG